MRWISKHLSRKVAKAIDKAQEMVYNGYGEIRAGLMILVEEVANAQESSHAFAAGQPGLCSSGFRGQRG
jgi:hypothetical protein